MPFLERLDDAVRSRTLIRLERTVEEGSAIGYVAAVGAEWFLLHVVADDINFDGWQAMRVEDLSVVEAPHDYFEFIERALDLRGARRPEMPEIDLASVRSILESADRAFRLVTVHFERDDPDVCLIGHVAAFDAERVELRTLGPDAEWDEEPEAFELRAITRVDFGSRYEQALLLVADAQ